MFLPQTGNRPTRKTRTAMSPKYFLELLLLSALWGASFIFMRISAPEFGATNMAALRIVIAAITLSPLLYLAGKPYLTGHQNKLKVMSQITLVGIGNSVIPFLLFAYAAINIDAGLSSIINATTPLWGALFGILILSNKLTKTGYFGLLLGFVGVTVLSEHKLSPNINAETLSILVAITATSLYGISTNFSKRYLQGVPPLLIASGTMAGGALVMAPILIFSGSSLSGVSQDAWLAIILLGVVSTGIAYILFYRLIDNIGPIKAMMVTYLIPIFGVLFGHIFLAEQVYLNMLFGGLLILIGVLLNSNLIKKGN